MQAITRFFTSGAHWAGMAAAALALVPLAVFALPAAGWALVPLGYALGFYAGGRWFGFPGWRLPHWDALQFQDHGEPQQTVRNALAVIQNLADRNPGARLSAPLQARVATLCGHIDHMLMQWARHGTSLSPEESYQARHIVLSYLPQALDTYLAIPAAVARTRALAHGRTAEDMLCTTLDDLQAKVQQLSHDLAAQDTQAFLNHSRFLHEKFGANHNPVPKP